MEQKKAYLWTEDVPGGCHWSGIIRRGMTLHLTNINGGANAAVLFYNCEEKSERYNMADTLKSQHTFYLTKGHACHSDMGRIFCCISEDTCGWHDTVCGLIDAKHIRQKYGVARYQTHQNRMYRSGLDGMLIELGKWGLNQRDIVPNINFFSKVTADTNGELTFHTNHSQAGDHIDLSFVMDTLVVLSTAPHPLDTAESYQPNVINLTASVTSDDAITICTSIAENSRGLENTQRFNACCEGGA